MYLALDEHELKLVKEAVAHLVNHPKEDRPALYIVNNRLQKERYPKFSDPSIFMVDKDAR